MPIRRKTRTLDQIRSWASTSVDVVEEPVAVHSRSWSTVWKVVTAGGSCFVKECAEGARFEPELTASLASRSPDLLPEVIAHDAEHGLLLMRDAGVPIGIYGNPPEAWLDVLPRYAELQRGEVRHVDEHVASGVPDLRPNELPRLYEELVQQPLPLDDDERAWLRGFSARFTQLCEQLEAPPTIQHDDLHMNNVFDRDGHLRVLDWGDASIGHPYFSLFETFRFLEEVTRLSPTDPLLRRLVDVYLEPWPREQRDDFDAALTVAGFAHAVAWLRQRPHLEASDHAPFDRAFATVLRRAVERARLSAT